MQAGHEITSIAETAVTFTLMCETTLRSDYD